MWATIVAIIKLGLDWALGRQKQQNEFTEAGRAEAQRDAAQGGISEVDKAAQARQDATSYVTTSPDAVRDPTDPNIRPFNPDRPE